MNQEPSRLAELLAHEAQARTELRIAMGFEERPGFVYQLDSIVSRPTAIQWGLGLNDSLLNGKRIKLHILVEDYLLARQRLADMRRKFPQQRDSRGRKLPCPSLVFWHERLLYKSELRLRCALSQTETTHRRIQIPEVPMQIAAPTVKAARAADRRYGCRCSACASVLGVA